MAFKPANAGKSNSTGGKQFEDTRNYPVPKAGNRKARVSLIVDLGIQEREDFVEKDGSTKPQKPVHQVAVFADLVQDVVDYGGKIGEQQYRLMLNKSFQGVVQGINFVTVQPRDNDGNIIKDKKWGFHPANLLTKLAKAVDLEDICTEGNENSLDIDLLLDKPFLANVEVKITDDKNGKKDDSGKVIQYKNVNFKAASPVPTDEDEDGNEIPGKVGKLRQEAMSITFDNAEKDDIQYIRGNLIAMIKQATNYAGSNMQKAIEAFEAEKGGSKDEGESEQEEKPAKKEKPATPKKSPKAPVEDTEFDDAPF